MTNKDYYNLIERIEKEDKILTRYKGICEICNKDFDNSLFKHYCDIKHFDEAVRKAVENVFNKDEVKKKIDEIVKRETSWRKINEECM